MNDIEKSWVIESFGGIESQIKLVKDFIQRMPTMVVPDETASAERLEAIWNKLGSFINPSRYNRLQDWATAEIGYKYYGEHQKHPLDLCEYIRDKLRDLNEERLTELEAILE